MNTQSSHFSVTFKEAISMGNIIEKELDLVQREYSVDDSEENPGKITLYLSITPEIHYALQINFSNYPEKKPELLLPSELFDELGDPSKFLFNLREWDSHTPPHIVEIIHELEDLLQRIIYPNDEMEELMREFNAHMIGPYRLQVSLYSYKMKVYEFQLVHKKPNPPSFQLNKDLEQIIKPQELLTLQDWPQSRLIEICRELSQKIDHRTRILDELKQLDLKKEYKKTISKQNQELIITVPVEIETGETCELEIKLTEEFPLAPPDIELKNVSNDLLRDDLNEFLLTIYNEWQHADTIIEVLDDVKNFLKRKSKNICPICHEYKCPKCKKPLLETTIKGISSQNECKQQCNSCHTIFHRDCWNEAIKLTRKCPVCLAQSSVFL